MFLRGHLKRKKKNSLRHTWLGRPADNFPDVQLAAKIKHHCRNFDPIGIVTSMALARKIRKEYPSVSE
jgi:hypothetical protein